MTRTNLSKNKTQTDDKQTCVQEQSTDRMCLSVRTCRLGSDVLPSQHSKQNKHTCYVDTSEMLEKKEQIKKSQTSYLTQILDLLIRKADHT